MIMNNKCPRCGKEYPVLPDPMPEEPEYAITSPYDDCVIAIAFSSPEAAQAWLDDWNRRVGR